MRIRSIKPEFWVSESMGRVTRDARLVFVGLWSAADDFGRFRADPRYLAGQLFPYDADGVQTVSQGLQALCSEGCVSLYEVDRSHYGEITGWSTHQRIDKPSNRSAFPAPIPREPSSTPREPSGSPREASTSEKPQLSETRDLRALANHFEDSSTPRNDSSGEQGTGSREQGEEQGAGTVRPPPVQIVRLPSPQPAVPVDRHSSGSAYLAFLNQERLAAGLAEERSMHPAKFDAWFSEAMGDLNGDGDRLDATVAAFSRDPYWKKQQLPLRALLKQWRDFVPRKAAAR